MKNNIRSAIAVATVCTLMGGAVGNILPYRGGTSAFRIASLSSSAECSDDVTVTEETITEETATEENAQANQQSVICDSLLQQDTLSLEEAECNGIPAESMKVIQWNDKHVLSWNILMKANVFTPQFYMTAGQYLNISATYSPGSTTGYVVYTTPDHVVHVLKGDSCVNKQIKVTQTGKYRVGFCNRGLKMVRLTGYYRTSK